MDVMVGKLDGGLWLLLGTVSMLLKLTVTLPLIQPLFNAGVVVTLVLGCTGPRIGNRMELKLFVFPVLLSASPVMLLKILTNPLHVLSALAPQLRAVSLPMMYPGAITGFCAGSRS